MDSAHHSTPTVRHSLTVDGPFASSKGSLSGDFASSAQSSRRRRRAAVVGVESKVNEDFGVTPRAENVRARKHDG